MGGTTTAATTGRGGRWAMVDLVVAIVGVSASAPIIVAAAGVGPWALAFWRCAIGAVVTGLWVAARRRAALAALDARTLTRIAFAGFLLAAHFAAWVPSLRYTSVAASTAMVATQPVWAAVLARLRGTPVHPRAWVGIVTALTGALVLTGIDFTLSARAVFGDVLALLGALLAAAYVTVGQQARSRPAAAGGPVGTAEYTLVCYAAAAVSLGVLCAATGTPLGGYSTHDWAMVGALTLASQLIGHTLINRALGRLSAMVVSLAILFELPGAVLISAVWLGAWPPVELLPSLVLILLGLVITVGAPSVPARPSSRGR